MDLPKKITTVSAEEVVKEIPLVEVPICAFDWTCASCNIHYREFLSFSQQYPIFCRNCMTLITFM